MHGKNFVEHIYEILGLYYLKNSIDHSDLKTILIFTNNLYHLTFNYFVLVEFVK